MSAEIVTYESICRDVANWLSSATGNVVTEVLDTISEGVPDYPCMKIYVDQGEVDQPSDTDRATFGAGVRRTKVTIKVDAIAKPRANLGEDLLAQIKQIDAIDNQLSELTKVPLFGTQTIKSCHWRWERVTWDYAQTKYVGSDWTIDVWVY